MLCSVQTVYSVLCYFQSFEFDSTVRGQLHYILSLVLIVIASVKFSWLRFAPQYSTLHWSDFKNEKFDDIIWYFAMSRIWRHLISLKCASIWRNFWNYDRSKSISTWLKTIFWNWYELPKNCRANYGKNRADFDDDPFKKLMNIMNIVEQRCEKTQKLYLVLASDDFTELTRASNSLLSVQNIRNT